jgi:hypothetical protein
MIGVIVIWAIVLFRLSGTEVYLDISLIGGAVVATLIATRWCRQSREFAVANPALALMEGADITEYQKFEAQMKGLTRGDTRLISDPIAPQTIPALPAAADPDA